jgi:hypothetical protein
MWKSLIFVCFLAGWGVACNNASSHTHGDGDGHDHDHDATEEAGDGKHFGATITEEGAITFEALLAQMSKVDSIPAKVIGAVGTVCQAKGCWMDIVSNSEGNEPMKVTFLDYGFFVPKDIAGRTVVMEGYAYRTVTSVDELRHYAEDEGLSKEEIEKITEPQQELRFLATGVLLLDEKTGMQ